MEAERLMAHAYLKSSTPQGVVAFCFKKPFRSRREALLAKGNTSRKDAGLKAFGSGKFEVFKCKGCGMWHLGHVRKGKR